jgi:hypothetical protein
MTSVFLDEGGRIQEIADLGKSNRVSDPPAGGFAIVNHPHVEG